MIVAGIVNYYVFIPVVIIVVVFLLLRWYYLTTAREIKRLEAVGKFVYFTENIGPNMHRIRQALSYEYMPYAKQSNYNGLTECRHV